MAFHVRSLTFESVVQHVLGDCGACPSTDPGQPLVNDWIWKAAGSFSYWLGALGIQNRDPNRVADWIRANMTRREKVPYEVSRMVERRFSAKVDPAASLHRETPKEEFSMDDLCDYAAKVPMIDHDYLIRHSPEHVDISWTQVMQRIHGTGANVFITTDMERRCGVSTHYPVGDEKVEGWLPKSVAANRHGAWFVINQFKPDATRAADSDLLDCRHVLLESDQEGCAHLWLRVLVQVPNVVSITLSGNVSAHAVVRVGAKNVQEFNEVRAELIRRYVPLGACFKSLTASRLSRLPNVKRGDNGNIQRLLYLNPNPDGTPIYKRSEPGITLARSRIL